MLFVVRSIQSTCPNFGHGTWALFQLGTLQNEGVGTFKSAPTAEQHYYLIQSLFNYEYGGSSIPSDVGAASAVLNV